ncbi:TERZ-like protein [Mya arenaria]|uniref:TERZ-like protein n=1 Tax=Mya arenaria TaxID=6604 RepID=A0ABY7ENF3_MYAAR|nr:TERZ-like protein [Mya arenaria]
MECSICNKSKLPNEFAPENVSDQCDHPTLFCLRCTVNSVKINSSCPHPGCARTACISDERIRFFQAILDTKFKAYASSELRMTNERADTVNRDAFKVTLLTGENFKIDFDSGMTIDALKDRIATIVKVNPDRQKLLYNDTELLERNEGQALCRLQDYNITPDSTVYLVVRLYSIPDNLQHVVFDLYWGYPEQGQDYLDASCIIFNSKRQHIATIDYNHRISVIVPGILHSGDVLDSERRIGHHTIDVDLKNIPKTVTHLFFTLSSFIAPTLANFQKPSLRFFEKGKESNDLCKTSFTHAKTSQAVIMASLSRDKRDQWEIFESGQLSQGNAIDYIPIICNIETLIQKGY